MFVTVAFIIIACMRVIQAFGNKRASNLLSGNSVFFLYVTYYEILMALFGVVSLLFFGTQNLNAQTVICSLVSAVLFAASSYANLTAMKGCKIVVVSLFSFGGLIVSCLLSWVWFGEAMSVFQAAGLVIFIVSMYMLSSRKKQSGEEEKRIDKKTWLLLFVVMLSDGLVMVAQKYFSLRVENGNVAWYSFFTFLFTAVFMACGLLITVFKQRATKNGESEKLKRLPKTLILCGIFLAFALFMINLLVTELGKTISSVILFPTSSAISLSVTALVGWIVYKEKLSVKNFIGLILGFTAIIVIAVFTPQIVKKFL